MPEEKKILSIPEPVAPEVQMSQEDQEKLGMRMKEHVELVLGAEFDGILVLAVKPDGTVSMVAIEPKNIASTVRLARAAGSSVDRLLR